MTRWSAMHGLPPPNGLSAVGISSVVFHKVPRSAPVLWRGTAVAAGAASASPTTASTRVRHGRDTSTSSIGYQRPSHRLGASVHAAGPISTSIPGSTPPARLRLRDGRADGCGPRGLMPPLRRELFRVALGLLQARVASAITEVSAGGRSVALVDMACAAD